jgi:hypothetical protein
LFAAFEKGINLTFMDVIIRLSSVCMPRSTIEHIISCLDSPRRGSSTPAISPLTTPSSSWPAITLGRDAEYFNLWIRGEMNNSNVLQLRMEARSLTHFQEKHVIKKKTLSHFVFTVCKVLRLSLIHLQSSVM